MKNLVVLHPTMTRQYYVYIITDRSQTLYVGVTNNLERRVFEHKTGSIDGFTNRYRLNQLVYFDAGTSIEGAISTEKVIKWWRRSKKIDLIEQTNPELKDLPEGWYETG
jgi:putative endonuclease